MRFRLGFVTGLATGYYLGAKAGRQRYDQINRSIRKLRTSDLLETVAGKAKDTVQQVLPHRSSNGSSDGSPNGTNTVPAATAAAPPPGGPTPYSSSR
jgi:hypothetical protein